MQIEISNLFRIMYIIYGFGATFVVMYAIRIAPTTTQKLRGVLIAFVWPAAFIFLICAVVLDAFAGSVADKVSERLTNSD